MSFTESYTQPQNGISLKEYVVLVNNDVDLALPDTSGHAYDTSLDNGRDPIDPEEVTPGDIVDVRSIASRSACDKLADGVVLRGTFTLQEENGVVMACATVVRPANMSAEDRYVSAVARLPLAYDWKGYNELLRASTTRGILQVVADVRLAHDQHETDPSQTTQVAEVATVYAAEQPFDGNENTIPIGGSVVIEGQVISTKDTDDEQTTTPSTLTITTPYGQEEIDTGRLGGRRQLCQLDPRYAPRSDSHLLHPARPIIGDRVQVRLYQTPARELSVDPGTFIKSTDIEAGAVPTVYVTEAGENRQTETIIRARQVASGIRRILSARSPGAYQRILGGFLLEHTNRDGELDLDPSERVAFEAAIAPDAKEGWHPAGADLTDHRLAMRILETTGMNVYSLTARNLKNIATSYMRGANLPPNNSSNALLDLLRVARETMPDTYNKLVVSALEEHGPATVQAVEEAGQINEINHAVLQFALQAGSAAAQENHAQAQSFLELTAQVAGALPSDSRLTYSLQATVTDALHKFTKSMIALGGNAANTTNKAALADHILSVTAHLKHSVNLRTGTVWEMSQSPDKVTQFEAAHTPDPQDLMAKIEAIEVLLDKE